MAAVAVDSAGWVGAAPDPDVASPAVANRRRVDPLALLLAALLPCIAPVGAGADDLPSRKQLSREREGEERRGEDSTFWCGKVRLTKLTK